MSAPGNQFASVLEQRFVELFQSADAALPVAVLDSGTNVAALVHVFTAKTEDPAKAPRLVIQSGSGEEAIYQTGIYELPVRFTVVTDIDSANRSDASELFARVVDVVQWKDLKAALMATGTLHIFGFGTPKLSPNEGFDDRQWIESVEVPVFGYSLPV
jgi:hypothetical protein